MHICENVAFVYDGSYEGLLCCVYECVYTKCMPIAIISEAEFQPNLWDVRTIYNDEEKAQRVEKSFSLKLGDEAATLVKTVFLSCIDEKELVILRFLLFAYDVGKKAVNLLGNEFVAPMWDAHRHLHNEKHLLLGFVRFSDIDGALVAFISPKNFVLPFIKHHFCTRLANENFLIFDKTHKAALIYKDGNAEICDLDGLEIPEISEEEAMFRALWKRFYDTICIEPRRNERCRMGHMPKRYWENMPELHDELYGAKSLSSASIKA